MPQIYYGFYNSTRAYTNAIHEWESLIENEDIDYYIALAFYKVGKEDKYAKNGFNEWVENNNIIRIISHNDADGISAAAVLANALKEENVQFHTTIVPRLKEDLINQLRHEKHDLVIFSDMGSSFVGELNSFKCDVIIADHHQVSDVEAESRFFKFTD